jgi:probable HAF family extracellular repeat protein
MKTLISSLRVSFAVLLMIVTVSSLSAAQQYTVTDLGTLPGEQTSDAFAISSNGFVAGTAEAPPGGFNHAFFWSASNGMVDLGLLNANDFESFGYGVNDSGSVVGQSGISGFLWTETGGMVDLGTLGSTEGGTIAYGINNLGQVIGGSTLADNVTEHAFLWSATNGMEDLGTLGGNDSLALAINDSGQVAGFSYLSDNKTFHAFIWTQENGMVDLGSLGGTQSVGLAENSLGMVTGYTTTTSGAYLSFVWDALHGMKSLGSTGSASTTTTGINDSSQIVGYWTVGPHQTALLWTRRMGFQNLNGFLSGKPSIVNAFAINHSGQIVGLGSNRHAILLTPIKQPSQRSKP